MQCITGWRNGQWQWCLVIHVIAVLGLVVLSSEGEKLESVGGWVACPPCWVGIGRKRQRERHSGGGFAWRAGWAWMRRGWIVVAARSEALLALATLTGHPEWGWVGIVPLGNWVWKGIGVAWPRLGRHPLYHALGRLLEEAGRVALVGLLLLWLIQYLQAVGESGGYGLWAGLGSVVREPSVEVEEDAQGVYHVRLRGEFELHIDGQVAFYKRVLVIFLGQLTVPGGTRGSRRTRDGQTPFVRQQQLESWFGVCQPVISRWMKYWLKQDWRRLLSRQSSDVLTLETQQRIIDTWVQFPWWDAERLWEHVKEQGEEIPLSQVRQAARESGWSVLRTSLRRVYAIGKESFRPRDEWLVCQLLAQVQKLVAQLEQVGGLTPERTIALADLQMLSEEIGLRPAAARVPLPWVLQVEHLLFGHWQLIDDDTLHCIYCGSTHVSRKSKKPRVKRYVDEHGKEQAVHVYRYYCHNPACKYQTFTNLPPNLTPYSKWTLNHHLAALQQYEWSHSVYRCTCQQLGVSKMTAYRWVSGFGYQLLPVAALFGLVRSSGVIGIDEKYVLVPKNDKPEAKMKEWMYVYFAVDGYTYDLLHIEIYPYNTKHSAKAFLLALRAKGYRPRVLVTDLRVDYGPLVASIFPKATYHECIFHALQDAHKHIKEVYGTDYAKTHPEVDRLRQQIDHIFDACTKRTAWRRYQQVLAQRRSFVAQTPEAAAVFDFLERHWPKLVNAIESRLIPTTNNATEEVIRIFTQHYKTFCGFENIDTAKLYLGVFEKVYRFTPFSADAQERIRGRCPLELAGYDVQRLPMFHLFRGLALQWPAAAFRELVPNV